jgi:hypothetical protein
MSPYDYWKLAAPEDEPDEPEDDTNDRADAEEGWEDE